MHPLLLTSLLIVANVLGAGMILPQALRLHGKRDTAGVSGAWVGVGLAMNAWWLAYGLQEELWGLIPVSSVAGLLYATIAWQLVAILGEAATRQITTGALSIGIIPLPFLLGGGWGAAGVAIGFCYGLQFAPAAVTAVRSSRLVGVSPSTWIMAWVEAVIWVIYGRSIGDWALMIGGTAGTVMASIILARVAMTTTYLTKAMAISHRGDGNVRTIRSRIVEV